LQTFLHNQLSAEFWGQVLGYGSRLQRALAREWRNIRGQGESRTISAMFREWWCQLAGRNQPSSSADCRFKQAISEKISLEILENRGTSQRLQFQAIIFSHAVALIGGEVDVIYRYHVGKKLLKLGSSAMMAVQWAERLLIGQ
jgi:hypothetical protein